MSATTNKTALSTFNSYPKVPLKHVVCGNAHVLWACDAFKKKTPIGRYKEARGE